MKIANAFLLAIALASVPAASGCGGPTGERCDALCDCESCSDRGYEECEIETDFAIEISEIYGCEDLYLEYQDCEVAKYRCRDGDYRLENGDCASEANRYNECVSDGSAIR